MTLDEIKEQKNAELKVELDRLRRHMFDLRAQAVTEKLKNPYELTKARKTVARILTVLRQRDLKVE